MLGGVRDAAKMARKAIKRKKVGEKSGSGSTRRAAAIKKISELMKREGISKEQLTPQRRGIKGDPRDTGPGTTGRKRPVNMKRVKKAADSLRKMGGGKIHGDKKKKDMMYGGEMKKKKGMMGGGKVYTSMDKKYGGGIFPKKGNI